MRKLECNSKEGIIDFIEKSEEFSLVKKHYLGMLIETVFERYLKEILNLAGKNALTCFAIYWQEQENKAPFINLLEKHMKLAGIRISTEVRENYKSINHLVHKIESQPVEHIIYLLSQSLIHKLEKENSKEELEISPLLQRAFKSPRSVTFLLNSKAALIGFPDILKESGCIDFSRQEAYYFNFFELLRRLLPETNIEKVISGFRKQYEMISGSSEKAFSELPLEDKKEVRKERLAWDHFRALKIHKGMQPAVGFFLVGCWLFLTFNERKDTFTNQQNSWEQKVVRSDLIIPIDSHFLKRPIIMSQIEKAFDGRQDIQTIALAGIGGSGKTTIARDYATHQEFPVIWEINAETRETLLESFKNLAYALCNTEKEKIF